MTTINLYATNDLNLLISRPAFSSPSNSNLITVYSHGYRMVLQRTVVTDDRCICDGKDPNV